MQSFLTVFPEYQGLPVYITGESYGGMYIPWIAQHIVKTQTNNEWEKKFYPGAPDLIAINLQGVAIGNGVIDEEVQDATYPEYAYTHGLIPLEAKEFADSQFEKCKEKLDKKARTRSLINHGDISDCDTMGLVRSANHPTKTRYQNIPSHDTSVDHSLTRMTGVGHGRQAQRIQHQHLHTIRRHGRAKLCLHDIHERPSHPRALTRTRKQSSWIEL